MTPGFYLNSSVKNGRILAIFGVENPEETSYRMVINL